MAQEYRNELKYVVSLMQIACLRNRINGLMPMDPHAKEGRYNIRSVYFDDYRNTCYMENENGTSPREKFRIRIYNADTETIRLELKRKEGGKTRKSSCELTREQSMFLLTGKGLKDDASYPAVLRKFCVKYQAELYRPKVVVEYEREPYIYRSGNVRVTFDTDIRSSAQMESFFDQKIPVRPVMPAGYHLMEVKYDEYLPDHIYRALQLEHLTLATFSKYYLCRKYNMGGRIRNGI